MEFHDLFLEVRTSEAKDLEYSSLLSVIRECYEKFLVAGKTNTVLIGVMDRLENLTFMANTNELVEFMDHARHSSEFDYAAEFNPSQKCAINLLLTVIGAPQKGLYIKGFFALYVWRKLLPGMKFYSVGLSDQFYELGEIINHQGGYEMKTAKQIAELVEAQKKTAFFQIAEAEHCVRSRELVEEIDKAIEFIMDQYSS